MAHGLLVGEVIRGGAHGQLVGEVMRGGGAHGQLVGEVTRGTASRWVMRGGGGTHDPGGGNTRSLGALGA